MDPRLENFIDAFSTNGSSCRSECHCGKEFWDAYNTGYDWDEGEREELEKDKSATAIGHSVGSVYCQGKIYVMACDCWHEKAGEVINFMDRYGHQIASYLSKEKARKQSEADNSPIVT